MGKEIKIDPKIRDLLMLLGGGVLLGAFLVFPGLPLAFQSQLKPKRYKKYTKDWEKYNLFRLRAALKRLREQKMIKVEEEAGIPVVKLTEKGKLKVLKYNLEDLELKKQDKWDGKWRLIVYDIPSKKRSSMDAFRLMLKKIKCLSLQKSVYLTPHPCEEEIEFLREVFDIGKNVILLTISQIENEKAYRKYFGL